jgi:signal transduction histidine kinase
VPALRIIVKFTAAMLACICCILAIGAYCTWQREVAFFENDMRLDHAVVGDAVAKMVEKTWVGQGKDAAMAVPRQIDDGGRHLGLVLIDPAAGAQQQAEVSRAITDQVRRGETVFLRDRRYQRTFAPVHGPGGEAVILEVKEPLTEEQQFSRQSWQHTFYVAVAAIASCSLLTFVFGMLWVGRPIRLLCEAARRIGRGDLTGELRLSGHDELSVLANEMNEMSRALDHAGAILMQETERRIATSEQLRHADRLSTVGKLAAGVAHELGTPLNVVWAHANMIAKREVDGAEVLEGASTIAAQAERMTTIIRQLLDFARPRRAQRASTDLVQMARQTLQFLEPMAEKRGVALDCAPGCGASIAAADAGQMQQVFTNLMVNAIQATGAGGRVTIAIDEVEAESPPDRGGTFGVWHRVSVRDTGIGIAPELLGQLFEPFFTTKGVGDGTGLGLSVSRGIVSEHGGWIAVDSTIGVGSCFSVFLPMAGQEAGDAR